MEEQPDIGVLGLETSNYVPPKEEIVAARSWGSVLRNVEKLTSQAHEHLILPFLTKESRPLPPANEAYNWKEYIAVKASEWTDAKLLVPALSAGLVFAMGIGMSVYRRRISL